MHFYYSGLRDECDVEILHAAEVTRVLVDPHDLPHAAGFPNVVLDSGAYRAFKAGKPLDVQALIEAASSRQLDFVVADVFGDAEASWQVYQSVKKAITGQVIPVWPWGSAQELLTRLLDASQIVGIGGLVPYLRRSETVGDREVTLAALTEVVARHPGRFHAFGLCWAKALDVLWDLLYSADTSHWLAARRSTAMATYVHTKTGYLQEAPWKSLHASTAVAVAESVRALKTFGPVTWQCSQCGQPAPHHRMRLLPSGKRKCPTCGNKIVPEVQP